MSSDRELLELAAKADGLDVAFGGSYTTQAGTLVVYSGDTPHIKPMPPDNCPCAWNPLTDDGDALRLAVKLRLDVMHNELQDNDAWVMVQIVDCVEDVDGESNRAAATRRAIVRAAAEIGMALP